MNDVTQFHQFVLPAQFRRDPVEHVCKIGVRFRHESIAAGRIREPLHSFMTTPGDHVQIHRVSRRIDCIENRICSLQAALDLS